MTSASNGLIGVAGLALFLGACATTPMADTSDTSAVAPVRSGPAYERRDLANATPARLDSILGEPALTRREGRGEYRRYDLEQCSLIIILYPDDNNEVRAAQMETSAKQSGMAKPDLDQCLAAG